MNVDSQNTKKERARKKERKREHERKKERKKKRKKVKGNQSSIMIKIWRREPPTGLA